MTDSPWFRLLEIYVVCDDSPSVEAPRSIAAALKDAEEAGVSVREMAHLVGICSGFIQAAGIASGRESTRADLLRSLAEGWPS